MFLRFLNNNDYKGLLDLETLDQMVRADYSKLVQAENNAEMSMIEYLSENYEIEREIAKGKYIVKYDRRITFPVGAFFYIDENIYEVIRSISGYQKPTLVEHWEEYINQKGDISGHQVNNYSQFETYQSGDIVVYNDNMYICLQPNGYKFDDIRIPLLKSWSLVESNLWQPIDYVQWDVVKYEGDFYTLLTEEGFDNNNTPFDCDCWGMIGDYDPEYNQYDITGHDYVVYESYVFKPEFNVNSDTPEESVNIAKNDPRNQNIKRHLSRLAVYEVTKLIAANNVSVVRIRDYEDSMEWLKAASRLKINPQIPRKIGNGNLPVLDWGMATFQTEFDPDQNPWLT